MAKSIQEQFKSLLDAAPTPLDRMFRAYAMKAALEADSDGAEIKKLIKDAYDKVREGGT